MIRVLSRLMVPAALVTSCTLLLSSSHAANPASGTISGSGQGFAYDGSGPYVVSNATGANGGDPVCSGSGQDCDDFALTVNLPADYHANHPKDNIVIAVSWTQTTG